MSDLAKISNQGIIDEMTLPQGFSDSLNGQEQPHNYLQFDKNGSFAMICYEQTPEAFIEEDIASLEKLLAEDLGDKEFRELNINGMTGKENDDSEVFNALCLCFVFGGGLTRGGTVMDIDKCKWELRRIQSEKGDSKTVVIGRLKYADATGRKSKREVLVALPLAPTKNGCGYLWLEGYSSELRRFEKDFFNSLASAKFQKL